MARHSTMHGKVGQNGAIYGKLYRRNKLRRPMAQRRKLHGWLSCRVLQAAWRQPRAPAPDVVAEQSEV